jgi:hypothetical protein
LKTAQASGLFSTRLPSAQWYIVWTVLPAHIQPRAAVAHRPSDLATQVLGASYLHERLERPALLTDATRLGLRS